ncbi:YoaK family protein [Fusobacterium sp.]|uniref:YoaK family protein n=1 Tax=Fusobacterium sp. TaxID=68766 RepID=UPI0025C10139|nr:YoaK family protein [Fusobacterium sp.]
MRVLHRLLLNWIYMLCFLGGFINTISIAKYSYTVSHFTGHVSKAAINIGDGNFLEVFKIMSIIIAFILGSTISGSLVDGREFNLKRRYGYSIFTLGCGLLLLYATAKDSWIFFYYLPFMIGVQNGLFISYKGVVVRTSHISGSLTDTGVYIGHCLKGKKQDKWKVYFCIFTVLIFLLGSFFGIEFYYLLRDKVFIIAGFGYIAIACIYFSLRHRYRHVLHLTDEHYHFQ